MSLCHGLTSGVRGFLGSVTYFALDEQTVLPLIFTLISFPPAKQQLLKSNQIGQKSTYLALMVLYRLY
jgi:hypothetical protein